MNDSICMIGALPSKLKKYCKSPRRLSAPADSEPFEQPMFKQDTITYKGYIIDSDNKGRKRQGSIYTIDILTGERISHTINISGSGYFEVKFLYACPQICLVWLSGISGKVFVEPGKELFHLIDRTPGCEAVLFMGDCAKINTGLAGLQQTGGFLAHYNKMIDTILHLMFDITTIPRYMLVGKDGKIIDSNVGHKTNNELRSLLTKYLDAD